STFSAVTNTSGSQTLAVQFGQETFTLASNQIGGQMGGLDAYENGVLLPMMQSVTGMAQQLATDVNNQLAAGFAPDGTAGAPLFEFDAAGTTGVLKLAP